MHVSKEICLNFSFLETNLPYFFEYNTQARFEEVNLEFFLLRKYNTQG